MLNEKQLSEIQEYAADLQKEGEKFLRYLRMYKTSKFLSLVLRHKPEILDIELDEEGWTDTYELIDALNDADHQISFNDLKDIVDGNDKKRFKFSEDFSKIRASQGHSVEVDLNLRCLCPPAVLYHGTVEKSIKSIKYNGLTKRNRHHAHLSKDMDTATIVGGRRGSPIILVIRSWDMWVNGHIFYLSDNGVWLTDHVPAKYIQFP